MMSTTQIQEERVRDLNGEGVRDGDYVLYWMQSSQRAEHNHALEHAIQRANELDQRLLVVFGLTADYPETNLRHYTFMLEGLKDAQEALKRREIKLAGREGGAYDLGGLGGPLANGPYHADRLYPDPSSRLLSTAKRAYPPPGVFASINGGMDRRRPYSFERSNLSKREVVGTMT